jgi:hypothetical protein
MKLGHVLVRAEKVDLAVEVGAQVVAVRKELSVGPTIPKCTTRCRSRWGAALDFFEAIEAVDLCTQSCYDRIGLELHNQAFFVAV